MRTSWSNRRTPISQAPARKEEEDRRHSGAPERFRQYARPREYPARRGSQARAKCRVVRGAFQGAGRFRPWPRESWTPRFCRSLKLRFRKAALRSATWVDCRADKVARALAALERRPPEASARQVGAIVSACALGYLDLRFEGLWRSAPPRAAAWLEAFAAGAPAFAATRFRARRVARETTKARRASPPGAKIESDRLRTCSSGRRGSATSSYRPSAPDSFCFGAAHRDIRPWRRCCW